MMEEERSEKDSGSVWTSYSDLFMAIAVVFLIMFVFSILAAGLQKAQIVSERENEKNYQMGKIPAKVKDKNQQDMQEIIDSIAKINKRKSQMKKNLEEISQFSEYLDERKQALIRIKEENLKNISMLNSANLKIEMRDQRIKELAQQLAYRDKENEMSKKEKIDAHKKLTEAESQVAEKIKILAEIKKENDELRKKLSQQTDLHHQFANQSSTNEKKLADLSRVMDDLKKENSEKNQMISDLERDLKTKNQDIEEKQLQLARLIKKTEKVENENGKTIQDLQKSNDHLKKKINKKQDENTKLMESITSQEKKFREAIAGMSAKHQENMKQAKISHGKRERNLKNELEKSKQTLMGINIDLSKTTEDLNASQSAVASLNQKVGELENKVRQEGEKNGAAKHKIKDLEGDMKKLHSNNEKLMGDLDNSRSKIERLSELNSNLEKNLAEEKKICAIANEKNGKMASNLNQKNDRIKSLLALVAKKKDNVNDLTSDLKNKRNEMKDMRNKLSNVSGELHKIKTERKRIARRITNKLYNNGIDALLDPTTGVITMRLDDIFTFTNASYELSREAREKIRRIIPVYAESLFEDGWTKSRIAAVTVTGFASPRYRKKYIDPNSDDMEAYDYNMELSLKRAKKISQYIFSDNIGSYPYKKYLRSITQVAGKGYSQPVPRVATTMDVEKETERCGKFDCERSRRVEINFLLKDQYLSNDQMKAVVGQKIKNLNLKIRGSDADGQHEEPSIFNSDGKFNLNLSH